MMAHRFAIIAGLGPHNFNSRRESQISRLTKELLEYPPRARHIGYTAMERTDENPQAQTRYNLAGER